MTEGPFTRFDQAGAVADGVIAGIKPEQFDDPTPCTDWTVRGLINHVVTGSLAFIGILTGQQPPDRTQDHLGDDPLEAFRTSLRDLRAAFSDEGVLERTYPTPLGPGPGALLVRMRALEMTTHAWDLAKATGQSTDLDPDLAGWALHSLQNALPPDRAGSPFGPEQTAPPGASAADRLAAFAGRTVG